MTIDTMPAGREMDALVAEKVMGWKFTQRSVKIPPDPLLDVWLDTEGALMDFVAMWSPSTSISAAWEVWEKITKEDDGSWAIYGNKDGTVDVQHFHPGYIGDLEQSCGNDISEEGPFPLAICRAVLKAISNEK